MIIINLQLKNVNLCFNAFGSGTPMIILHGWGASKETFNRFGKDFADKYKVYLIDLPGFGESEIGLPLSVYDVADVIIEFIEKMNIDNPIIGGHSYGGRIAIIVASRINVKKLFLISSAGVKIKLSLLKKMKVKMYKLLKKTRFKNKLGSTDFRSSNNVKRAMLVNAVNTDLRTEMQLIKAPTILIYGKKDSVTPIEVANTINDNITGSYLFTIEEAEHFVYITHYSIVKLILSCFLEG